MTTEHDNLAQQRVLYGEPLADIASRITATLGLTQARLASVLGVSAPMLSQLLSGRRAKIGNPVVLARLHALTELAASGLAIGEIEGRLAQIQNQSTGWTTATVSADVDAALRASAPAEELLRLAALTTAPRLAALLRAAAQSSGTTGDSRPGESSGGHEPGGQGAAGHG